MPPMSCHVHLERVCSRPTSWQWSPVRVAPPPCPTARELLVLVILRGLLGVLLNLHTLVAENFGCFLSLRLKTTDLHREPQDREFIPSTTRPSAASLKTTQDRRPQDHRPIETSLSAVHEVGAVRKCTMSSARNSPQCSIASPYSQSSVATCVKSPGHQDEALLKGLGLQHPIGTQNWQPRRSPRRTG
jgi:hypothetical protein